METKPGRWKKIRIALLAALPILLTAAYVQSACVVTPLLPAHTDSAGDGQGMGSHPSAAPEGGRIYVSPDGSDKNTGGIGDPLKTMGAARDAIRAVKAGRGLPPGGITVYFRDGIYPVTETICFDERDSGTREFPIRYAAYPGETPVFSGGSYIPGAAFSAVTDPDMLSRLYPEVRGEILCYNLFANGFSYTELDYAKGFWREGNLLENDDPRYYNHGYSVPRMQVFLDDEALYLARFPNKADGIFAENPYSRYLMIQEPDIIESGMDRAGETLTGMSPKLKIHDRRVKNWRNLNDIIVFGMLGVGYDYGEMIAAIDPESMCVSFDKCPPATGLLPRGRYAFANVFEELDRPGEYYIDKNTGMLYVYPVKDMSEATVKISRFEGDYMFGIQNASHIVFSGLCAELTKGSVMSIMGGNNIAVEGCTLKNYGLRGVKIGDNVLPSFSYLTTYGTPRYQETFDVIPAAVNGYGHSIRSTMFLNTGYEAAWIAAGHIGYRQKGGAVFENNVVKHSGIIGSTYNSGLTLAGCGITVKNNAFLFCRGQAISGYVIDAEVVYNEFADSPCEMAEDTGTIYFNYCTQNDGVNIRYNYFHDVTNSGGSGYEHTLRGAAYFDTNMPFGNFSYNIVYNYPSGVSFISHTSPRTEIGNIFIDTLATFESIPPEFIRDYYKGETGRQYLENDGYALGPHYYSGLYADETWRKSFPELYEYYEYMLAEKPNLYPMMSEVRDNLVVYLARRMSLRSGKLPLTMDADPKYGGFGNNHYFTSDPGFVDYKNYDFQLTRDAARRLGVAWIDMGKIGVPGLPRLVRVSDAYKDKDRWTPATYDPLIQLAGGLPSAVVAFWRYISPGVWEWAAEDALTVEGVCGLRAIPGAVYTAYYPGCADYPAQFLGGLNGEYPPDGARTFTVDPNRSRWDYYVFELVKD